MDRVQDLLDEIKFISFNSVELERLGNLIIIYAYEKAEEESE